MISFIIYVLAQQPYNQLQRQDKNIRGNISSIYHKLKHTAKRYEEHITSGNRQQE